MTNLKEILNKQFGLGDLAYYLFRPAVYFIDWVWGTDLKDCDKCKERRADWNLGYSMEIWQWLLWGTSFALLASCAAF